MSGQRVAALWFPDWPAQAYALASDDGSALGTRPVIIARDHRVLVCSVAARQSGVRRGMRVRQAQALCPGVEVASVDEDRDARFFEPIVSGLDEAAASVEVLRPGLVVVELGAAARFHGGEDAAAQLLIDAAQRRGIDSCVGIADELATAILAARAGRVVPPGGSRAFLSDLPLRVLAAEVALGCGKGGVDKLHQLGVTTLGQLAQLPVRAVTTRFGAQGRRCHDIACAVADRRVAPDASPVDLAVSMRPEHPIERVDAAAFAARTLATALHQRLAAAGLSCQRLRVTAEFDYSRQRSRIWRTREALSESDTAQRVRWQLDGWLTAGATGPLTALYLDPVEASPPDPAGPLWGADTGTQAQSRVVSRVTATLGTDAVVQPRLAGGRGVAERIALIPYGDDPTPATTAEEGRWPGRIPPPLPTRMISPTHPASAITVLDGSGQRVLITAEALLSAPPVGVAWAGARYRVTGWAGPWPVDAQWWDTATGRPRLARLQLSGTDPRTAEQRAWLLVWVERTWRVEGMYE